MICFPLALAVLALLKHLRRIFPVQLIPNVTMAPRSFRFATVKDDLTAVWWRDCRDMYALSTMHNKSVVTVLKRPKGSREKQPLVCPSIIADYNKYMEGGGFDRPALVILCNE